jgi:hypothetical protein
MTSRGRAGPGKYHPAPGLRAPRPAGVSGEHKQNWYPAGKVGGSPGTSARVSRSPPDSPACCSLPRPSTADSMTPPSGPDAFPLGLVQAPGRPRYPLQHPPFPPPGGHSVCDRHDDTLVRGPDRCRG